MQTPTRGLRAAPTGRVLNGVRVALQALPGATCLCSEEPREARLSLEALGESVEVRVDCLHVYILDVSSMPLPLSILPSHRQRC